MHKVFFHFFFSPPVAVKFDDDKITNNLIRFRCYGIERWENDSRGNKISRLYNFLTLFFVSSYECFSAKLHNACGHDIEWHVTCVFIIQSEFKKRASSLNRGSKITNYLCSCYVPWSFIVKIYGKRDANFFYDEISF